MTHSRRIFVLFVVMVAVTTLLWTLSASGQGGGADFTRFVGVGDSLTAGVIARGCVGVIGPANMLAGVRIVLVGSRMNNAELGTAQDWTVVADSGFIDVRDKQTVCAQGDPVAALGGAQVQTGLVVQVRGLPKGAEMTASQLSIDTTSGRTLQTFTRQIQ